MIEQGTISFVSREKGFAFCVPDLKGEDVFVPPRLGRFLKLGDRVEFVSESTARGISARELKVIGAGE
jgi:cold shock CspA family protein